MRQSERSQPGGGRGRSIATTSRLFTQRTRPSLVDAHLQALNRHDRTPPQGRKLLHPTKMLPPDTTPTLFMWHVVVAAMQMHGYFPLRMSIERDLPILSLPRCLWSVFAFLLQAATLSMGFDEKNLQNFSSDVGTMTYITSSTLFSASMSHTRFRECPERRGGSCTACPRGQESP